MLVANDHWTSAFLLWNIKESVRCLLSSLLVPVSFTLWVVAMCNLIVNWRVTQLTEQHVIRRRVIWFHRHSHMWASCPLIPLAIFSRSICVAWDLWCVGEYKENVIEMWIDGKITYVVWDSRGSMYLINDLNITENVDVLRILNLLINLSVSCIIFTHQFTLSYVK